MNESPPPPDPEIPNDQGLDELGGLSPRDLFVDGLRTPAETGKWEPPSAEHVARLLPQFRVEALIGHGGMGAVYRAAQPRLDRLVAIKLLPAELAANEEFVARFEREARTLAKLHHPNIVGIHDFGQTGEGHLYFVMEFVDGTDLARIISTGTLEAMQALALTIQICEALQYAHSQQVIHRDIKPANVLVTLDGHAKLADFGLARPLNESEIAALTASNLVMGTPDYMAPEQRAGLGDHRVDIYALGVMLYEMLTGRRPHGIFDPPSMKVQVDVRLDEVVIKAMREEPERRYQQASEMRMDVDRIRSTPQPKIVKKPDVKSAAKQAALKPPPRPVKVRRARPAMSAWIIPLATVALLVIVAIVAVQSGWLQPSSSPKSPVEEGSGSPKDGGISSSLPSTGWISLMDKIDPAADAVKGQWTREADGIHAEAVGQPSCVLQLPYEPPLEYDFRIAFTAHKNETEATQILTAMGHRFRWITSGGSASGKSAGFSRVGGKNIGDSDASVKLLEPALLNRRYESLVEVRRDRVTGYIDGRKMVEWKTDYSDMSLELIHALRDPDCLGIGAWDSATTFHDISVREVTGKGKFLRETAPALSQAGFVSATREKPFENTLGMKFVPVPILGGPTNGQRVLFSVWDTRVRDYEVFVKDTKHEWPKPDFEQGPTHPAVMVSWDDAQVFCQWLTTREQAAGRLPAEWHYRLPGDHEWSCAVGIGESEDAAKFPSEKSGRISDVFPWGTQWPPPAGAGNYAGEELLPLVAAGKYSYLKEVIAGYRDAFVQTAPVGSFAANQFGLYDMGGNVWQWCEDWIDKEHKNRMLRGAAWDHSDRGRMLSSFRRYYVPGVRNSDQGFRCVLVPANSTSTAAATNPSAQLPSDGWISLMDRTDPVADAVEGVWTRVADGIHAEGAGPRYYVLQLPYEPPMEYDFRITFTSQRGVNEAHQFLAAMGHEFHWTNAGGRKSPGWWAGFSTVGGKQIEDSTASLKLSESPAPNRRYESVVEVRRDRLTGYIDGRKMVEWKPDYSGLGNNSNSSLRDSNHLGIGVWNSATTFHDISVREVTGKGKFLRDAKPASASALPVEISPASPSLGSDWRYLFEGNSFKGWDPSTINPWYVDNNEKALVSDKGGMLLAEPKLLNYELQLEWRMKPGANGGLFYGVQEKAFNQAPEFQLCDPGAAAGPKSSGGPKDQSGSLCSVLAPTRDATKPVGQWNTARLVVNGTQRQHWINDVQVLLYDLASPSYQEALNASGHKNKAPFMSAAAGAIALQSNWGGVAYRNIRVRELPARPEPSSGAVPAPGLTATGLAAGSVPSSAPLEPASATKEKPFVNTLGMKFVPVPILGGPTNGQRVLFSIWDTRVQDYEVFVKDTKREWPKPDFEQGPTHPAVMVSWDDAQVFCQWLTLREQAAGRLPADQHYRLPSDHEWSCAVGIGEQEDAAKPPVEKSGHSDEIFPWGAQWPPPAGAGNYAGEELRLAQAAGKFNRIKELIPGYNDGFATTSPVGSFPMNRLGLCDMGGNVQQWCEDWFNKDHAHRVLRGASWDYSERRMLALSSRSISVPSSRLNARGFRCVLAPDGSSPHTTLPVQAESTQTTTATKEKPFMNSLGMKFVPVPGTKVLFSIWETRVKDYAAFATANVVDDGWKRLHKDDLPTGSEPDHPVCAVSWNDAKEFSQWLTKKERSEDKLPQGMTYRLPTDEEWSKAVGLKEETGATPKERSMKNRVDFPWGTEFPPKAKSGNFADSVWHAKFPNQSWIEGYTDGYATTAPVGTFAANQFGIYDLAGNVSEWCEDLFEPGSARRIRRGSSWHDSRQDFLLSSFRGSDDPAYGTDESFGFRCVLAPATSNTAASLPSATWISLMDRIDPVADAVKGEWSRVADGIQGAHISKVPDPTLLQLPYEPPLEYDFRIAFTALDGNLELTQILSAFGHQFRWTTACGPREKFAGFGKVDGKLVQDSPAAIKLSGQLVTHRRYESLVEVRRDRVTGYIDGKKIVDWPTDYHEMQKDEPYVLRNVQALGVANWSSRTIFHDISVREVTGKGKFLREAQTVPTPAAAAGGTTPAKGP